VVEILDIFHAYEHLWDAGRAAFAAPEARAAWAAPLEDALYEGGAPAVLAALDALAARPLELAAAETLRRARAYVADNAARLDYPRFVAQQLPIGSGAVESLCKTLIEARAKGAGMRWTARRAASWSTPSTQPTLRSTPSTSARHSWMPRTAAGPTWLSTTAARSTAARSITSRPSTVGRPG